MRFSRGETSSEGVNLTPLIDVVFLLLIFFMVSTTFTKETRLQLNLPEASEGVAAVDNPFEVAILETGKVRIGDSTIDLSERMLMIDALGELHLSHKGETLVLVADAQASHQSVITVMDVAGSVGITQVSMATVAIDQ